jgi:endonuclease/exonuclease/phosphatase family metal-dependent hydrolase
MNSISILTLNLWNVNPPLEDRLDRLVMFLKRVRPDVVCLQEISPIDGIPESTRIAESSSYEHHFYSLPGEWEGRVEGLATLTRLPATLIGVTFLPDSPGDLHRILLRVSVRVNQNRRIEVANTHLAFRAAAGQDRAIQAVNIARVLSEDKRELGESQILCGDLNDEPLSSAVQSLLTDTRLNLVDAWQVIHAEERGETFSGANTWASRDLNPGRRIDYVFVERTLRVESCDIVLDSAEPVSDHYGVLCRVQA